VSKPWKRLLESSHSLWTVLDTRSTKKAISLKSLKIYVRRSNCTVEQAIITMKANIDAEKMKFITRTCKTLREINIVGSGLIGDSLNSALPDAKNLNELSISQNTEITLSAVQTAMKTCSKSLTSIRCYNVKRNRGDAFEGRWPATETLTSITLQSQGIWHLDIVSLLSVFFLCSCWISDPS
jgi:F-box/TPR repeat protein Pof3